MSSSSGQKSLPAEPGSSLFVSDLHLAADTPAASARFLAFLNDVAPQADALYLLGDLFEAWIGDDDLASPPHAAVAAALQSLSAAGVRLFVLHGNRDFLLGPGFCAASGATLLEEPAVVDLYGTPTLLLHGDSLCTDDVAYQQFRAQTRDPAWQRALLARPLDERRQLARQLRAQSEMAKDDKTMAIMDVNAAAVAEALRKNACTRLIHGHTHRPARHLLDIDGRRCERWVLTDWDAARAGYLRCSAAGCAAVTLA